MSGKLLFGFPDKRHARPLSSAELRPEFSCPDAVALRMLATIAPVTDYLAGEYFIYNCQVEDITAIRSVIVSERICPTQSSARQQAYPGLAIEEQLLIGSYHLAQEQGFIAVVLAWSPSRANSAEEHVDITLIARHPDSSKVLRAVHSWQTAEQAEGRMGCGAGINLEDWQRGLQQRWWQLTGSSASPPEG